MLLLFEIKNGDINRKSGTGSPTVPEVQKIQSFNKLLVGVTFMRDEVSRVIRSNLLSTEIEGMSC